MVGSLVTDAQPWMRSAMFWLALACIAALGIAVFGTGLAAGFVSDAFLFLDEARKPLSGIGSAFVPEPNAGYRPLTETVFAVEFRLFGTNPVPFHVFALSAHFISASILALLSRHLLRSDVGAVAAAATFMFSIHAHEVVFDVADLHNAIGGPILFGTIYAFIRGYRLLSIGLATILFFVDETALLILPLLATYQLIFGEWHLRIRGLLEAAKPLMPHLILMATYLAFRVVGGGFASEVRDPCQTLACVVAGIDQYGKRAFLRPDTLISKEAPLIIVVGLIALIVALCPPRRADWRVALFGAAWAVATTLFFIASLWTYIADRFLYIPTAGIAIVIGVLVAGVADRFRRGPIRAIAAAVGFVAVVMWIAVGALSLSYRGILWTGAGEKAARIVQQINVLFPDPPENTVFYVRGLDPLFRPFIPPGGTGPYLFLNGFEPALRFRYDRWDIRAVAASAWSMPKANTVSVVIFTNGYVIEGPAPPAPGSAKLR